MTSTCITIAGSMTPEAEGGEVLRRAPAVLALGGGHGGGAGGGDRAAEGERPGAVGGELV